MEILIRYKLLVSILFYIFFGSSVFTNMLDLGEGTAQIVIWTSNAVLFVFWLFLLIDIIRQPIRDKIFWILSMVLIPFFAPVVYIHRRKNLLHLADNRFKNSRQLR